MPSVDSVDTLTVSVEKRSLIYGYDSRPISYTFRFFVNRAISFMRTNFERMPADFFDPFQPRREAENIPTTRWLPHSHANRH